MENGWQRTVYVYCCWHWCLVFGCGYSFTIRCIRCNAHLGVCREMHSDSSSLFIWTHFMILWVQVSISSLFQSDSTRVEFVLSLLFDCTSFVCACVDSNHFIHRTKNYLVSGKVCGSCAFWRLKIVDKQKYPLSWTEFKTSGKFHSHPLSPSVCWFTHPERRTHSIWE